MRRSIHLCLPLVLLEVVAAVAGRPARAVDGVHEINQTSALAGSVTPGDAPGFPVEIFTQGSFRLTSDLVVPAAVSAGIAIYAGGTRLDLNGFSITSTTQCTGNPTTCSPLGSGIGIDASGASDVAVRNGRVAGFGVRGIWLFEEGSVEDVTVENNGTGGIATDEGSLIEDNIVRRNGGVGIEAGAGSRIAKNVVHRNGGLGISAPLSALATENAVSLNVGSGKAGARNRRFLLATGTPPVGVIGSTARTSCPAGFHMASLWEIFDPTTLTYDSELGYPGFGNANDDLGSGPPSNVAGWVRTGWTSVLTPSGAGQVSCTGWTNGTISQQGTQATFRSTWTAPGDGWPWTLSTIQCNFPNGVWCVED